MTRIIFIIILFFNIKSFGQIHNDSDTSYNYFFSQLDNSLNKKQKDIIKNLSEDSLRKTGPYKSINLLDSNYIYHQIRYVYYPHEQYEFLILLYHRHLNSKSLELKRHFQYFDSIKNIDQISYENKLNRDSIDGIYIPSNLVDCLIELDKVLTKEQIREITMLTNKDDIYKYHTTWGRMIRNRWQLWGASRLKKYFLDQSNGFMHPDDMSSIILEYYYDWTHGIKDSWRQWEYETKR